MESPFDGVYISLSLLSFRIATNSLIMNPSQPPQDPMHASQHPFVLDADGFQVRVKKQDGTQTSIKRMGSADLYRHLKTNSSPTGSRETDSVFYAGQLVHYGLPQDLLPERAMSALRNGYRLKKGVPIIYVPETIRLLEKKLNQEFRQLQSVASAAVLNDKKRLLSAEETKLKDLKKKYTQVKNVVCGLRRDIERIETLVSPAQKGSRRTRRRDDAMQDEEDIFGEDHGGSAQGVVDEQGVADEIEAEDDSYEEDSAYEVEEVDELDDDSEEEREARTKRRRALGKRREDSI